jgi:hypothetical protein
MYAGGQPIAMRAGRGLAAPVTPAYRGTNAVARRGRSHVTTGRQMKREIARPGSTLNGP